MLNLRSMLAATFAVTFFCSVQHSFADEKIQLRGVFYEKLSGEESYDFDQRVYYGMDDGCTIDKIKPLQKKKYELHMSCGTADVGGPPVKVKRTMSAIKNGWRITSQNGETSDYIKSAE